MQKYNRGEKARIRLKFLRPDEHPFTEDGMEVWKGEIVTISGKNNCICGSCYEIEEDNGGFIWSERWLEPVEAASSASVEGSGVTKDVIDFLFKDFKPESSRM